MASNILSEAQCIKILENYTGSKNFTLQSYTVNPLQSQLDGLIGEQYTIKIHYQTPVGDGVAQFFLKTVNGSNTVMFELSKSICVYEKEAFYYQTLLPLFKSKGIDCDFAAKSYFCEPYIIVLEDLALASYKGTSKNKPLDEEHCKKCLEILARFHAAPILYEAEKSRDLGRKYSLNEEFRDILVDRYFSQEDNGATKFLKSSVEGLFKLIDLIPENGITKNEFKSKLQDLLNYIMVSNEDSLGFKSTILHGDLWSNNFLYKHDDNGAITDGKVIDFQTVKYGPPAMDVLQFLLTNTRKSFRNQHQNELLTYYYNYFSGLLRKSNIPASDLLSESEFQKTCDFFALPAKIQAVVDRSITFMSEKKFTEAAQTEEGFLKFLFEERGTYIVDSFKQDEGFRELMVEDMTELREMLFK